MQALQLGQAAFLSSSSSLGAIRRQPLVAHAGRHKEHANLGKRHQRVAGSRDNSRHQTQQATNRTGRVTSNSSNPSIAPSWSQRMASIQALMARAQQQLQGMTALEASKPALAKQLKARAEAHLDLLMQLAEAEQKHITGELESEELQQLLDEMQQQLDEEQQEALAAAHSSRTASPTLQDEAVKEKRSELLGSNQELRRAVGQASAELSTARQQEAASNKLLQEQLLETEAQLEAAEAALQDSQQLRMDFDSMCQRAFQLSRKLSEAEAQRAELQRELADVKSELAASTEELAEHRELQMQHDKLCQDMYRLRMKLQQAQSHGVDVAQDAASTANKHKQDVSWLMEAHRRELADLHMKNQQLTEGTQELRMRLLELEQQLWGQRSAAASAAAATAAPAPAATATESADATALVAQQKEQLALLQQTSQQLTQEKQQLMKSLQDMQRQQAVLLVELQQVREQQRQAQEEAAVAAAEAAAAAIEIAPAAEPSEAEIQLIQQLELAEQQRSSLIQQVQELQQSLQQTRAAAAAASAVAAASTAAGPAAGAGKLAEVKAEMVQLRVQLAATRRELLQVAGRAQAAEAALQQQAAEYEARLAQLQAWYGKQAAVAGQLRKGKRPAEGSVGFINSNRFWVGQELVFDFLKHWVAREAALQQQPGFLGLQVTPVPGVSSDGGVDVIIISYWESISLYEAWRNTPGAIQQHLPSGVYQYVPKKGEGFPEDFVPFRDYDEAVNAKY